MCLGNNVLTSSNTFSAKSNNLISGTSDNHPIIVNQNAVAGLNAKTFEGRNVEGDDVPPGYINPINIKTIRRTVNIDTRFRSPYFSTLSTDFHLSLPQQFKKIVKMEITSLEIPLSIYTVSKSLGNNFLSKINNNRNIYRLMGL